MLKTEDFGKLAVAIPIQDIDIALRLFASDFSTEIKEITSLPADIDLLKSDLVLEDSEKQDFSVLDYKFRLMENKINETNEHLDFIMKKIEVTPRMNGKMQYEFHVRNLEDLVDKVRKATNEVHEKVQDNLGKLATNAQAIDQATLNINILKSLSSNSFNKSHMAGFKFVDTRMIIVSSENYELFKEFVTSKKFLYFESRISEHDIFFIVAAPKSFSNLISENITLYNARTFTLKDDDFLSNGSLNLEKFAKRLQDLQDQRAKILDELKDIKKQYMEEIQALFELNTNAARFLSYHKKMHFFKDFVIAEFWVQLRDWPSLEKKLQNTLDTRIKYNFTVVKRADLPTDEEEEREEESKAEKPPSYVRVPRIFKPYTTVLRLYGIPRYNEINPLLFIFFTFPLLFGLMFGDVGQGICLIVFGLVMSRYRKLSSGWKNFMMVWFWCGIGAVGGGLLYGEIFGFPLVIPGYSPVFRPFGEGARPNDMINLFVFALEIGSIQITLGFILRGINYAITKRKFLIITNVFPKISILWLGWYFFSGPRGIDMSIFVDPAYYIADLYLLACFLLLIVGEVIGKSLKLPYLKKKKAGSLVGNGIMDSFIETLLALLSNVMSYARLFGLCIVHLALMYAVSVMALQISGGNAIGFGILYGVGNVLVVMLELIIVTIQSIRLHFYEFFSKFYQGGGKAFAPMQYDVKFSRLYFDNNELFLIKEITT